jgi:hypothetical protein
VTDKLTREGMLTGQVSARAIRLDLDQKLAAVWDRGHMSVGELWAYYCRHPYLTRLRDRSVLDDAVRHALAQITWATEGFALAEGWDDAAARYAGLVLPGGDARFGAVTDSTLLVHPALAQSQEDRETAPWRGEEEAGAGTDAGGDDRSGPPVRTEPARPRRYFGVLRLDPERYQKDFNGLSNEILQPLAALDGVELEVTVEVHARWGGGFPDDKIRVVSENARTLKLDQSAFDTD